MWFNRSTGLTSGPVSRAGFLRVQPCCCPTHDSLQPLLLGTLSEHLENQEGPRLPMEAESGCSQVCACVSTVLCPQDPLGDQTTFPNCVGEPASEPSDDRDAGLLQSLTEDCVQPVSWAPVCFLTFPSAQARRSPCKLHLTRPLACSHHQTATGSLPARAEPGPPSGRWLHS